MRYELVHFLSHVENEQTMIRVIRNLNADAYGDLLHHLEYTSPDTQERWQKILRKVLS
ncbi:MULTISPECIES: hypothetical protein [Paenibacillus]|uniref:hypothetical protein n=1 Tax=Paenibacillus TaxID=44249 RepID=UPI00088D9504|nr:MULTISPECIES: hypothetical protein [Paenibacillus]WDQ31184.1 hypothetical protein PTQ21_22595 [Paenibacillus marchantiae]SDK48267.1 hypothetical protein SAMN05428961_102218 [Paenibacillus sp. OK060]SEA67736.1 hypothetical protein SAMN03159332_2186 [Paenibacillus sp. 276b]SHN60396.1 hypothetical protein SAMN04487896_1526 [Paenibacillus sp. ov031]SLJ88602.1 hypothetical protein SAMN06272722_101200 [Paenibacillus sp. RU5A]